ncbi:hydantoinase B/oxoprolinase family protein [Legionella clemsonensis]|uniref:Acetophenone carboxylase gamma subunit n=1 Tax=Legionella clemsonensis TaxID=1867846 RepID=A0A222NZ02_9GAMM|nr:hydantoinase B/oxoprolinase family protein [Legionella clemsonensis]ASQ44824.1 Acetophenone carboxylase gamma subunit [Legionella clemsonensis]
MSQSRWEIFIDRGGTFTDIVARNPQGQLLTRKLLSDNPEAAEDAVIQGIKELLKLKTTQSISDQNIAFVKMGTTLSTNTLLERKGEPVVLAITQGFGDVLRIGYQKRPEIFALNIVLPSLLYEHVIEIKERIDAKGNVLQPLDSLHAETCMQQAYNQGYRAIAIVLMHGYRFQQHERTLARLAQQIGFQQISVSHQVAPVMKLVGRGDTTVVDAYLSPILHRYIGNLQKQLKHIPLFFMQSNGGLINIKGFKGKESIFSGPAGGVVGMVKTSQQAGFNKVIGFDMGGTSTDVSHFAGKYERHYACEFAGIRLRTPMMLIHTIAAGGGSVLHFDGLRFTVGPDSAGANPGPCCYGRGGPLTITDCNVILGKIQAKFFPKLFGKTGNQPIDINSVRKKFQQLTTNINQATDRQQTIEQVAEGYLRIAVENMANAIKKISVQRGYDIGEYLLNCFGGAAGQHACLVADNLNIKTILIHPLAGVLSAYGIGLAEVRILREFPVEKPLTAAVLPVLVAKYHDLEQANDEALRAQGLLREVVHRRQIHLRYEGSDTMLAVDYGSLKQIKNAFINQHRAQFGFADLNKNLIIEGILVETVTEQFELNEKEEPLSSRQQNAIPVKQVVSVFSQNNMHQVPLYERHELKPGDCIKGLAILSETNATTIIEPGWQAQVTTKHHLLLTRIQPLPSSKIHSKRANPVMLEIFNNRFMNIAEQMGEVLQKTANSVNIKERLDFSCAIFDEKGELVANAPHIPVHLGSMSASVKNILSQNRSSIHPGDVFVLNDPYNGGTHLPDITVITPFFAPNDSKLLFFLGSRGHHADIGGLTPGSIPATSKTIEEEGILINNFKIVDRGCFLEKDLLQKLTASPYPARNPKQNIEDLKAQIAANAYGIYGLNELINQFGLNVVQAYMKHVRTNASLAVKQLLRKLKTSHFCYRLDDGSQIKVHIRLKKIKTTVKACIDFTGTSAQHQGNFNAPTAICHAAILYVLRCLIAENIPLNSGCFEAINLIIPPYSLLNPSYPAAVVAGNVETSQYVVDTLLGALKAVAASQGTCNNFTFGNATYQYYETLCGGAGAGPNFNGASAVHTHMTNTQLTDPEVLEWRFPVLLEEFSVRAGSGGSGKYHGGDGVIRRLRFLEPMTANIISSHRKIPPFGLHGGLPGKTGHNWIQRANGTIEELGGCAQAEMQQGDVFIIETPGGGGYGKKSN